jgi:hypothetical protein
MCNPLNHALASNSMKEDKYSECPIYLSALDTFENFNNLAILHRTFDYTLPNHLLGNGFES